MNRKISKVQGRAMNSYFVGKQGEWTIFSTEHSELRSKERELNFDDMIFNISLIMDFMTEHDIIKDVIEYSNTRKWSNSIKRVQIRDDLNDTNFILAFYPVEKEVHIITCINQAKDRELYSRKHTSIKADVLAIILNNKGYNMYLTSFSNDGIHLELINSNNKISNMDEYIM